MEKNRNNKNKLNYFTYDFLVGRTHGTGRTKTQYDKDKNRLELRGKNLYKIGVLDFCCGTNYNKLKNYS